MKSFRARLQIAIALLLLLSVAGTARATPAVLADTATWTPIVTLPVGNDAGQVGYRFHVEGAGNMGPQALAARSDGTLYLLDSVHQRIHVIANGVLRNTILLPFVNYPSDILAADDNLYLLDDNRVLQVSYAGALAREYPLPPGLAGHQVYRLVAGPNGRVFLWTAYYRVFELDRLPAQVDLEAGVWQKQRAGRGIASPGGDVWIGEAGDLTAGRLVSPDGRRTIEVAARGTFGSMRLVGFERGRSQIYMLVEDLYDDNGQLGVELTLRRYQPDGRLTGIARLPNQDFVVAPRRTVELAADGALYAMVPAQDRVTIYRVELSQNYQSRIPERGAQNLVPAQSQPAALQGTPGVIGTDAGINSLSPLSRRTVRARAEQMADTIWTWHTSYDFFHSRNRSRPDDAIKPEQLVGAADGARFVGIPYTWGGLDSPWSHSDNQPWTNWSHALGIYYNKNPVENGPLVGKTNILCGIYDDICYPSGTYSGSAGIDCSGFVYAAAGFTTNPKKSTQNLQSDGVDWAAGTTGVPLNIQPMNFFVSDSHTFYYNYGIPDGSSINTLEATTDGSPQGAKRHSRNWSDITTGPYRFPYYRSWWNWQSGDGPGVAKTTLGAGTAGNGRGQSVWHRFTISGPRRVFLTHISGGDPDLSIYDANLQRVGVSANGGGEDEVVTVPAGGTYYARVYVFDEYAGSDGVSYSLDIPEPVGAGTYDDTSGSIIYGAGWSHGTGFARAYLSTMSWTYADRATAQLTFTGSRITRRYKMGPQRGGEWIAIDDDFPSYRSAAAPTTRWRVGETWMLPYGVHTIEVSADGIQGSDLDAFVVDIPYAGLGTYDNTYYQISYIGSGWLHGGFAGAYQGTLSYSGTAEDAVAFTFFGDCVTYYYTKGPGRGKAAITIDGNDWGFLDLYAPAVQFQSYSSFCGLGNSIHSLHISVSGQKNPASSGYTVDVDLLNVSSPG